MRLRERITDLEEYNEALKAEVVGLQLKLTAAGEREIAEKQREQPNSARSSTAGWFGLFALWCLNASFFTFCRVW